jgi:mannitol 2-dehydrogenase
MGDAPSELSARTLSALPGKVMIPGYDRAKVRAGIAHIGVGNFHRAHQALYIDRCLHLDGQEDWGIFGIGIRDGADARQKALALQHQDTLYTLTEYAPDGSTSVRVIGSIVDYLHAPENPEKALALLSDPAIRIVSLTITEGGYNIDEVTGEFALDEASVHHDLTDSGDPITVFGYVVEALDRRRRAGIVPFTIMSCDNLHHNGDVARRSFVSFARARDPHLADWIDAHVAFPNSMVDRITPSVPDEVRARVNAFSGIDDAVPVISESFLQWVIEDRFSAGRPALDKVGVLLRADVADYEDVKYRLLNASHTMLSYPAVLAGYHHVDEAMRNEGFFRYLKLFMERDVIPLLSAPDGVSLQDYKDEVLARFCNSATSDQLLRIAHDGIAKMPVFLVKTLRDLVAQNGSFDRVAFLLACFQRYFDGVDDHGDTFPVVEPHLSLADKALLKSGDPLAILKTKPFVGLSLFENRTFTEAFLRSRDAIMQYGAAHALECVEAERELAHCS